MVGESFFAAIFYGFTALLVDLFNSTKFVRSVVRSVVRSAALLVNILRPLLVFRAASLFTLRKNQLYWLICALFSRIATIYFC